jgi:hypothetical protein
MNATPVYWPCPGCGLGDGWEVAPTLRRVWVTASCPACDCDYRVLITRPVAGHPQCQLVHTDLGVVRTDPSGAMRG